jgi:hypothetical protein
MLVNQLQSDLGVDINRGERKILWFADSLNGSNGIPKTLQELGWNSYRNKQEIKIVTSYIHEDQKNSLPPNVIFLPTFFNTKIMGHDDVRLWFPSVLKSLDLLQREEPTEIIVSTPGPIGLLGLLVSRLMNIKIFGIYETDFTDGMSRVVEDRAIVEILESYARWFYSKLDTIKVHTPECIRLLETKGLESTRIELMPNGLDPNLTPAKPHERQFLSNLDCV